VARRVLYITTDMMRWDTLGCFGSETASTPVIDSLAEEGIQYWRAYNQNPLCMPSRSTMLTGQYTRHHGSWNNGIALPHDAPTIAQHMREQGIRTALIGKPHFEPFSSAHSMEANLGVEHSFGPARGFEFMIVASHDLVPETGHYTQWLKRYHPEDVDKYYPLLNMPEHPGDQVTMNVIPGGDTGCIFVSHNDIATDRYHTDWCADNAIRYMDFLGDEEDWFIWLSFPDPHHPYDPPKSELGRCPWRDMPHPDDFGDSDDQRLEWLRKKPEHYEWWYTGEKFVSFEAIQDFSYQGALTTDNVRELRATINVENALIDEAIGRVIRRLDEKGWLQDTDIIFTPDHGGWDGEYGLMLIGPTISDSVCRVPLVWRPAANSHVPAADVNAPVGLLDLAPTWCEILGIDVPEFVDGRPLPKSEEEAAEQRREHVFCQYEGYTPDCGIVMDGIVANGKKAVAYLPSFTYDGTQGEFYDLENDPMERENLWDDPSVRAERDDMVAAIRDNLYRVPMRHPLPEPGASI
jgi:arylsulfatase A-like enzyme